MKLWKRHDTRGVGKHRLHTCSGFRFSMAQTARCPEKMGVHINHRDWGLCHLLSLYTQATTFASVKFNLIVHQERLIPPHGDVNHDPGLQVLGGLSTEKERLLPLMNPIEMV